jgi:pyrrolidone-carboxylate peptidase
MTQARPDILVTGFGPFPRVRVNPTTALARAVTKRLRGRLTGVPERHKRRRHGA